MEWKINDSLPIWPQIKKQLMFEIIAGRYEKGGPFPTVRELAEDAKVNRNTMQRALAELETDGLVITNRTAGRTVTTDENLIAITREKLAKEKINSLMEEMNAIGFGADDILKLITDKVNISGK